MKTEHEANVGNVFAQCFSITDPFQVRPWSCQDGGDRIKFKEKFSATVRQFPVIYMIRAARIKGEKQTISSVGKITSTIKIGKTNLFNLFLIQMAESIVINDARLCTAV